MSDKTVPGGETQKILVFQENNSGENKIKGVVEYGRDLFHVKRINIQGAFPPLIDDPEEYLPSDWRADLVLDYLKHPDLSYELGTICVQKGIPVVASGKKHSDKTVLTPATCCGLARSRDLGSYGRLFGAPEINVHVKGGVVAKVEVLRGAPCGATWKAAPAVIGLTPEEALVKYGLETQFYCVADSSAWDPISGRSPVHLAAEFHAAALKKALKQAGAEF